MFSSVTLDPNARTDLTLEFYSYYSVYDNLRSGMFAYTLGLLPNYVNYRRLIMGSLRDNRQHTAEVLVSAERYNIFMWLPALPVAIVKGLITGLIMDTPPYGGEERIYADFSEQLERAVSGTGSRFVVGKIFQYFDREAVVLTPISAELKPGELLDVFNEYRQPCGVLRIERADRFYVVALATGATEIREGYTVMRQEGGPVEK